MTQVVSHLEPNALSADHSGEENQALQVLRESGRELVELLHGERTAPTGRRLHRVDGEYGLVDPLAAWAAELADGRRVRLATEDLRPSLA